MNAGFLTVAFRAPIFPHYTDPDLAPTSSLKLLDFRDSPRQSLSGFSPVYLSTCSSIWLIVLSFLIHMSGFTSIGSHFLSQTGRGTCLRTQQWPGPLHSLHFRSLCLCGLPLHLLSAWPLWMANKQPFNGLWKSVMLRFPKRYTSLFTLI